MRNNDHIPALDGLRAVAVLLVMWAHMPRVGTYYLSTAFKQASKYMFAAYIGVDIFFVLSGFLITRILLIDRRDSVGLFNFYLRRCFRIFPIYYAVIFVLVLVNPTEQLKWCALYLSNYYFAFDMAPHYLRHTWSLAVEEHFYLIWPLIVLYAPTKSARSLALFFVPLIAIFASILTIYYLDSDLASRLIYRGSVYRMISLSFGAAIAFYEIQVRSSKLKYLMPCSLLLMLVGTILLYFGEIKGVPVIKPLLIQLGGSLFSLASILFVLRLSEYDLIFTKMLSNRYIRYVGSISYGLYLYHYLIFKYLGFFSYESGGHYISPELALSGILITLLISSASYYMFEKPILNYSNRFKFKRIKAVNMVTDT